MRFSYQFNAQIRAIHTSQRAKQPLAVASTVANVLPTVEASQIQKSSPWIFGPVLDKQPATETDYAGLLTVDHREPIHIRTALENRGAIISTLPFGDFAFWKPSDVHGAHTHPTLTGVNMTLVVERKEIKDFARSVVDGRLASQLAQLQSSDVPHVHIVEGPFHSSVFKESGSFLGVPESRFLDALVELSVEHSCRVLHTMDSTQTMRVLQLLAKRTMDDAFVQKLVVKEKKVVRKSKTVLSVPSGVDANFVSSLTAIKGISLERAITLATVFPTQAQLIKYLEVNGEDSLKTLKAGDTTISDPPPARVVKVEGDSRRNFGKSVSKNVFSYYFGK